MSVRQWLRVGSIHSSLSFFLWETRSGILTFKLSRCNKVFIYNLPFLIYSHCIAAICTLPMSRRYRRLHGLLVNMERASLKVSYFSESTTYYGRLFLIQFTHSYPFYVNKIRPYLLSIKIKFSVSQNRLLYWYRHF